MPIWCWFLETKIKFSGWQVGCPMRAPCPVGWDRPARHASVTFLAQSPDVRPSNPASHFQSIPRSDSIEDQERQLYFKTHTLLQSCPPYVIFILLDLEMHWWTVYFEEYKSMDLDAIENVFYLTSDHIIPFRLVWWKTLMLHIVLWKVHNVTGAI